ncbi:hypothetical protein LINPERPRIM_LOCUS38709 [Linum perenne]
MTYGRLSVTTVGSF